MDGMSIPAPPASMDAVQSLIHSFGMMVTDMKRDLIREMERNAATSRERWAIWEQIQAEYRERTDRRLDSLEASVHDHHAAAERERLIWDSRLGPVRSATRFISMNWKSVLLVGFALLGAAGLAVGIVEELLILMAK